MIDKKREPDGKRSVRLEPVEAYEYVRLDGSFVWEKVKFLCRDVSSGEVVGKTFRPRYQTREQIESGSADWWTWGDHPEIARYPYELPALFEAVGEGRQLWLCEGEKDVHSVRDTWGYAASTHPTGVAGGVEKGGWSTEQLLWIKRADRQRLETTQRSLITICVDNDPTGHWLAAKTYAGLRKVAQWSPSRIRIVRPAVEQEHGDISDHIAAGLSEGSLRVVRVSSLAAAGHWTGRQAALVGGFRRAFGSGPTREELAEMAMARGSAALPRRRDPDSES